jgi:hypothetical protein
MRRRSVGEQMRMEKTVSVVFMVSDSPFVFIFAGVIFGSRAETPENTYWCKLLFEVFRPHSRRHGMPVTWNFCRIEATRCCGQVKFVWPSAASDFEIPCCREWGKM